MASGGKSHVPTGRAYYPGGVRMSLTKTEFQSDRKTGLDYLSFWSYGEFGDGEALEAKLAEFQELAKDRNGDVYLNINGLEFRIYPFGSGKATYRRRYQLVVGGIYFGICSVESSGDARRPQLKVEIKGQELLQLGEVKALELVEKVYRAIGYEEKSTKVSRADIRADFNTFTVQDVRDCFARGQGVSRAKKYVEYHGERFGKLEALYCGVARDSGKSGGVCCRFYDKLEEIKGNQFKQDLVRDLILNGQEVDTLTRVEFQLDRKAFTDRYELDSVDDLLSNLERIVEDLTLNWVRLHRDKITNGNQAYGKDDEDRHHKIWRAVRRVLSRIAASFDQKEAVAREKEEQSTERQAKAAFGYLAKLAAKEGRAVNSWRDFYRVVDEFVVTNLDEFKSRVCSEAKKLETRRLNGLMAFFENASRGDEGRRDPYERLAFQMELGEW